MKTTVIIVAACILVAVSAHHLPLSGYQPPLYNPYYQIFRYDNPLYSSFLNYHHPYQSSYPPPPPPYGHHVEQNIFNDYLLKQFLSQPYAFPPFNILEEVPFIVQSKFNVVPMVIAAGDSMKVFTKGKIIEISKVQPTMTLRTEANQLVQVTPAVKIVLEKPMIATTLKSNILFPSVIEINHEGVRIPIKVGAVIVPVPKETVVTEETPVIVRVVYAVSTTPLSIDYVNNNKDVILDGDNQAVVVDSDPVAQLPPKNVTILDFPEKEAEPNLQIDEDDESLVNRNPPIGIVPAGIVQSTQPHATVQEFHNSKESPLLTQLREEAAKHRLKSSSIY